MKKRLSLFLLGTFQVQLDGEPLTHFEYDKVRALLAYLAIESGFPQRRDVLTGLLWPEQTDKKARHSLSQALLTLRQALGDPNAEHPFILTDRTSVQIDPQADVWLDTAEFEQLAVIGDEADATLRHRLRRAADLYRGEFLKGISVGDSPAFDEWLVVQQERLHRLALDVLHRLANVYEWRGEYKTALHVAQRQVELEPWREEAQQQLIRLLAYTGQRSAALAQFETCRRLLWEELGLEPASATLRLAQQLRDADEPCHNLPTPATPFVGREEEVAQMSALLAHPACRMLTIVGPGGMGKTRAALRLAQQKINVFLDGVYFVPLTAVETADSLLNAIAQAVTFAFYRPQERPGQLIDYLRRKELLLILDNFEHLLSHDGRTAVQWLGELLENAPGVKTVIISRERLNVPWENVFTLPGLAWPPPDDLTGAEAYGAFRLFLQSARRVQANFAPDATDVAAIARVCELVEGMPLALELAASWVRAVACREIAAELARNIDFLQTSSTAVAARHRSIRAVFDHSWRLLPPGEQRLWAALSVFRGGFTHRAAAAVAGASLTDLASLVDKSLIRLQSNGRYEVHELLRQYAVEKLTRQPETVHQAQEAHALFFAALLQARPRDPGEQKQAATEWDHEMSNVRVAWRWLVQHGRWSVLDHCLHPLFQVYALRGWSAEGRELLQMAADHLATAEPRAEVERLRARVLVRLGRLHSQRSDFAAAQASIEAGLSLLRRLDLNEEVALALHFLGDVHAGVGRYEAAQAMLQESLAIYRQLDDQPGTAAVLNQLGSAVHHLGDYAAAQAHYAEGFVLAQAIGDATAEAVSHHRLGQMAYDLGDYVEAEHHYQASLALARALENRLGVANALNHLGNLCYARGEYGEAGRYYHESLEIREELGDRSGMASALNNLGIVAFWQQNYTEAHQRYEESLALARAIGNKRNVALALDNLGELAFALGDYDAAKAYHEQSLRLFQEIGQVRGAMYVLNFLGVVALAQGLPQEARSYHRQALDLALARQATPRGLEALTGLAAVALHEGDVPTARTLLAPVLTHPACEQNTYEKAQSLLAAASTGATAEATSEESTADWEAVARALLGEAAP